MINELINMLVEGCTEGAGGSAGPLDGEVRPPCADQVQDEGGEPELENLLAGSKGYIQEGRRGHIRRGSHG